MITPDKEARLREAAERATAGPWASAGRFVTSGHDQIAYAEALDAAYIAEADPQTVLALLAERERLRGALDALLAVAEMTTFSDQYPAECEAARAALGGSHE